MGVYYCITDRGVGKTCASIEQKDSRNSRQIVVLLNKSLTQNFIENLKFCGYDYFENKSTLDFS